LPQQSGGQRTGKSARLSECAKSTGRYLLKLCDIRLTMELLIARGLKGQ
jgi:hypothetical protein